MSAGGAGLRGVVGRIALGRMIGGGRTDNDERTVGRTEHLIKSGRARHQADQIDFQHMTKSRHFEFAAPVDHRPLRQHQHIEPVERWLKIFDRIGIVDVKLSVIQTRKIGTLAH